MTPAKLGTFPTDPTWLFLAVEGTDMKRVNQYLFYQMGMNIHPLGSIRAGAPIQELAWTLYTAREWLQYLLKNQDIQLVVCKTAIQNLISKIDLLIPQDYKDFVSIDPAKELDAIDHWGLTHRLEEFETVLANELPTMDTYVVWKKGIYSTADLIERAEDAIEPTARKRLILSVPNAITDLNQAGRCLAFEVPTASGFHTMRATEAILREYWRLVRKPDAGTKPPEMQQCINELRAEGEEPKLMDILDHIRVLHRNTLMHPEAFLTMKEALRLFDIAKSAISAMADRIGELVPVPDEATIEEIPDLYEESP